MSWRQLFPAILSLTFTLSLLTFFTEYASPLVIPWPIIPARALDGKGPAIGITDILLQTGLLMGFVLLALRRWRLPMGVFTLIFALNAGLMAAFNPQVVVSLLPGSLLGGLAADLLYKRLQPAEERPESARLFAFASDALPLVLPQPGDSWTTPFYERHYVVYPFLGRLDRDSRYRGLPAQLRHDPTTET